MTPWPSNPIQSPPTGLVTDVGASPKNSIIAKLIVYYGFSLLFLKYVLLAPFAVLIMTWCKQLLLIGLFLMSLFSFLQYEGCTNVVFIRLWELVRESFLAVAAETQMSAGYVAKAIWLAMHSEPEKVPLFKWGWKLDVSTLFIVKCVAHIKSALEFLLIS